MRLFLPLLAIIGGCAEFSIASDASLEAPGATSSGESDSSLDGLSPPTSPADTDTEPVIPVFWSIDGELAVLGDAIDLDASYLVVRTWDESLDGTCAYDVDLLSASSMPFDDEEVAVYSWWDLELSDATTDDPGCADWPATLFSLGIGEYDPRLDPALDAHGWGASQVYGLYLQEPGEPLFVVGVAATADQFEGAAPIETMSPLADGIYEVHSVVLLDLSR